jgi:hypothetical protein
MSRIRIRTGCGSSIGGRSTKPVWAVDVTGTLLLAEAVTISTD